MAAEPPPHQHPRRVALRADQLAGLELLQLDRERTRGRVAVGRVARRRLVDDRREVSRNALDPADRRWRTVEHRLQDPVSGLARVRRSSRQYVIQQNAERVHVGRRVERLAARLLGRHVRRRPHDRAGHRRAGAAAPTVRPHCDVGLAALIREVLGKPPVDDDRLAVVADEDVRRLEVAVDHRTVVRVGERVDDRDHAWKECESLGDGRQLRDHLVQ